MHRDFSIEPPRRRFSVGASARFFYLGEAIARVYEPTQTQLSDLDRAYQSTGEYLVTCPEFDGLLYLVHAHGSRQLGTMVRPMEEYREGFDIDLAACLTREVSSDMAAPVARRGSSTTSTPRSSGTPTVTT